MTTLPELIARLEQATGPDRNTEIAIFKFIGLTPFQERHCKQWCVMDGCTDLTKDRYMDAWAPAFTSSIDAALTLVPEGWYGRVEPRFYSEYDKFEKRVALWNAYCIRPRWEDASPVSDDYFDVVGNTEPHADRAIALCIAALRSRLTGGER